MKEKLSLVMRCAMLTALLAVCSVGFAQQTKQVTGQVVDETGEPLIGATVAVWTQDKQTFGLAGTVTDFDGNFTIQNVPENALLHISYVGYQDLEVSVSGKTQFNVTMKPDDKVIDEVVVIGYGVQKKSNVTGAISSIKADDMKNSTVTNAASAIQGKVSGVQVVNNSGAPGSNPTIRIRGFSSNGKSDPLYIVDGLKVTDISYLDPSSIKSMEILKDAASAAIYGAEAGNGVILITTKGGDKGRTSITFDAQWTFSNIANKIDMMNADQFTKFYTEGAGEGFTTLYNQYNIAGTDTNWQDEMFETGKMQKYNVGLSGGNDQGAFFVSLGWVNNDGMVRLDRDFYHRLNGQINATYKLRPWLEVGTSNTIMASNGSSLSESVKNGGQMSGIINADPLTPVYYTNDNIPARIQSAIAAGLHPLKDRQGRYYGLSWVNNGVNPLTGVDADQIINKLSSINGSTYANITPFKNFVFTTRLGYTIGNVVQQEYVPTRLTGYFRDSDTPLRLTDAQYTTRYYQWENFANYTYETEKAGNFMLMAGMSYSHYDQNYVTTQTNDLSSEAPNFIHMNYSTNSADDYVGGGLNRRRQIAYYGRFTWDYLDRYNVQVNFRADSYDAAYLDLDHNWGYFPSISAGWIFSNENFMKNVKGLSYGKLRLSYGVNGSISNLGNYMYASTLRSGMYDQSSAIGNMTYYMDGKLVTGIYPNSVLANPKLRWERSKQFDVGLDLRFLSNRLTFTADYYHKMTDGLLVQSVSPLTTGTTTVYQNLGKVKNTGLELEIDWKDNIGDFKYGVKANFSTVSNKVSEYKGEGGRIEGSGLLGASSALTYFEEGYPLWYIRGYKLEGVNQQTGEPIYADMTGDGEITDADRTDLGCGIPKFTYGLTLTAAYKGIDFSIYGAGASGNKIVYGLMSTDITSRANRPLFTYEGHWTAAGQQASMPSAVYQINDPRFYNSDAFVFSGSFFKIKQIQLGYSFPKNLLKHIYMENLRAYVSLDNFFTFTNYPGTDPEVNASANTASGLAIDYGGYPMSKSVSFGFNVSF